MPKLISFSVRFLEAWQGTAKPAGAFSGIQAMSAMLFSDVL